MSSTPSAQQPTVRCCATVCGGGYRRLFAYSQAALEAAGIVYASKRNDGGNQGWRVMFAVLYLLRRPAEAQPAPGQWWLDLSRRPVCQP